jgi:predicted NBD/HSP70 family sugar kinase
VVHNRVINGRQGIGGEWGHNFLHESGGPCYCGKTGCVEMVLAGPALERYYAGQSGTALRCPRWWNATGRAATRTRGHHPPHDRLFRQAISVVINIADPDAS